MSGQRFGRLVTTDRERRTKRPYLVYVTCVCDCGSVVEANRTDLRRGKINSCGCSRRKHGGTGTRLHRIWKNMRGRCSNPKIPEYPWYGGKGIRICDEWHDFENFREWAIGAGYTDELTIDRIDSDDDYRPGNCEWVTRSENSRRANVKRAA